MLNVFSQNTDIFTAVISLLKLCILLQRMITEIATVPMETVLFPNHGAD